MPFCPKCGKEVPEEADFCSACGYDMRQAKKLSNETIAQTSQPSLPKERETPKYQPLPLKKKIIAIFLALIPGFFLMGLGHFYVGKKERGIIFLVTGFVLLGIITADISILSTFAVLAYLILWMFQIYDAPRKVRVQEVKSGLQIPSIPEAIKGLLISTTEGIPNLLISFLVSLILISIILSFPVDYTTGNRPYLNAVNIITLSIPTSFIVTYMWGISKRCPSCKKLFAEEKVGKELLDVDEGYETVKRYDTIYDEEGKRVGDVKRREQVHMIYGTYKHYYKCKFCGFEWNKIATEKHEG